MSTALIRTNTDRTTFALTEPATEAKSQALIRAAAVGAVRNEDENARAVEAQVELKRVDSLLESARVEATRPLLEAQRSLKAFVDKEREDLRDEWTRVTRLVGNYQEAQLAKRRAEEAAQREALAAEERARQAELAKAATLEQRDAINEKHDRIAAAVAVPSPPPVRAEGQTVREEWVVDGVNDWALLKARPDLVRKIEFDLVAIKRELAEGKTLPGVKAHKEVKAGVRVNPRAGKLIEI